MLLCQIWQERVTLHITQTVHRYPRKEGTWRKPFTPEEIESASKYAEKLFGLLIINVMPVKAINSWSVSW